MVREVVTGDRISVGFVCFLGLGEFVEIVLVFSELGIEFWCWYINVLGF